ncbi:MAG: universal stress protein [Pyrinomonadaceae bacterium]
MILKRVLVEVAEEWGVDCIVVGSTGFSNRLERFVLSSVSAAVVARTHCSVEVARKSPPIRLSCGSLSVYISRTSFTEGGVIAYSLLPTNTKPDQ